MLFSSLPDVNYHHVNKEIEREKDPAALLKSLLESFAEDRITSRKHLGNHLCLVLCVQIQSETDFQLVDM